ncbi:MAG: FtsX-like permease family protein [Betaproteobacteria bacterium]
MSIFHLALAYARRRSLATLLVVVLLAIGVATVALTLLISRELEAHLTRDAEGIDLVVGAKGSPLQIVLAGVYHVDVPPGNIPLAAVQFLRKNPMIAQVIPLSLGDSFRGFRIVGTEPEFVAQYGGSLAHGELWSLPLDAVLGSDVARASQLRVGDRFVGSHGFAEGGGAHADARYTVTGVLAPTGAVIDRLVLTSLASVWAVHERHHDDDDDGDHARGTAAAKESGSSGDKVAPAATPSTAMPGPTREVTLALVKYRTPLAAASLPRTINKETELVAASPAFETARLLTVFSAGVDMIRAFAWILVAASTLMLFVALAQALDERRYDLAIMRALGASRVQVATVLLTESLVLAAIGAVLGLVIAHLAAAAIGWWLPQAAPLAAAARHFVPEEWAIVALALAAGIIAALWPAWRAYRLDVAATLAEG